MDVESSQGRPNGRSGGEAQRRRACAGCCENQLIVEITESKTRNSELFGRLRIRTRISDARGQWGTGDYATRAIAVEKLSN